jgi:uncharacterized membrane protein YeaQ/YmgE (transglycosylase-associated protein family)
MPDMGILGWIVVGFLAGALSGLVFRNRTARGCLPNILVGILGGVIGGYLAQTVLGLSSTSGFLGALAVAFIGAVIVRFLIGMTERR